MCPCEEKKKNGRWGKEITGFEKRFQKMIFGQVGKKGLSQFLKKQSIITKDLPELMRRSAQKLK